MSDAISLWRESRAEFENHRLHEYGLAEDATNGSMLNGRGQRAGVDPLSLFMGNQARAHAYASDELREYWAHERRRPKYEEWERDWWQRKLRELAE